MPVMDLPHEIVLEITKLINLNDAINLLSTCKTLYHITNSRAFWMDQLRCLYFVFQPFLTLQLDTLSISELQEMVTKPYHFEKTIITHKIHRGSPFHLKPYLSGDFRGCQNSVWWAMARHLEHGMERELGATFPVVSAALADNPTFPEDVPIRCKGETTG